MTPTAAPPTIEVFADLWCTFAHVGLRLIDRARSDAGRDDVLIQVRAWPLELVNGAPMDARKTLEHIHELQEHVAPDLFQGFDVDHFPSTTLPGLALVARAQHIDLRLGERASFLVRDALFERGLDIADPSVVAALAAEVGIAAPGVEDAALVQSDYAEGRARGVIGSPHFFAAGRNEFCPSLQIARGDHGLTITRDTQRLGTFLDAVFADLR